jgi:hypothetical protein
MKRPRMAMFEYLVV